MRETIILFDLDGTILNTLPDLRNAANHALEVLGFPSRTDEEIRRFLGNGVGFLMKRALPEGCPEDIWEKAVELQKTYYLSHLMVETRPYKEVPEMMEQLRKEGYRLGTVSNKFDAAVQKLISAFFPGVFDVALGERKNVPKKPDPAMVQEALREMHAQEDCRLIYVGDSEVDLRTAENARAVPILVDWGFRDREELQHLGDHRIVSSAGELMDLIRII